MDLHSLSPQGLSAFVEANRMWHTLSVVDGRIHARRSSLEGFGLGIRQCDQGVADEAGFGKRGLASHIENRRERLHARLKDNLMRCILLSLLCGIFLRIFLRKVMWERLATKYKQFSRTDFHEYF